MVPKGSSLNRFFMEEGDDFPYCGFQEPLINLQRKRVWFRNVLRAGFIPEGRNVSLFINLI